MLDVFGQASGAKVAFGDVVRLSKERSQDPEADGFERYVGLEHLEPDNLKIRKWGNIEDGVTFTSVFRPGQVLFGKRRAYQRKVAVADFNGVCSSDIYVLEPKNDQLLPELLPFICQSEPFYDYVISMSQGGLSPRVNWKALAKYEFSLPPLEEQGRIAEVLTAFERAGNYYLEASSESEKVYLSMLSHYFGRNFEARGDSSPRGNLGMLWPIASLEDLAEIKASNVDKKVKPDEESIELCNYMDVYLNDRITPRLQFMPATASIEEIKKFQIQQGDVLITKDSEDPLDIGVPSIVEDAFEKVVCGYHLAIVRPDICQLDSLFLAHYLRSTRARCYLYQMAQGVTRFGLGKSAIASFPICLPTLQEQQNLAEIFETCRRVIIDAKNQASYIHQKKSWLLKNKLEGIC